MNEVRYVFHPNRQTLARAPVTVLPVGATLQAPASAPAGSMITVEWQGPDNHNDFVTIVVADTPEGKHDNYQYTRRGTTLEIETPEDPGPHEVRYVTGQSRRTLARETIVLEPVTASLEAPASIAAGGTLEVNWQGPGNRQDFITLVKVGTPEGKHDQYAYTRNGSPAAIRVPQDQEPGDYEVRYVTGQQRKTLARTPVKVE